MQGILNTTEVAKLLQVEEKVAQRELKKALYISDSGVFKIGGQYRVMEETFLNYLINKRKKKCEENKKTQKEFTNEAMSGGCLIHQQENNIVSQLTSRIKKKQ